MRTAQHSTAQHTNADILRTLKRIMDLAAWLAKDIPGANGLEAPIASETAVRTWVVGISGS